MASAPICWPPAQGWNACFACPALMANLQFSAGSEGVYYCGLSQPLQYILQMRTDQAFEGPGQQTGVGCLFRPVINIFNRVAKAPNLACRATTLADSDQDVLSDGNRNWSQRTVVRVGTSCRLLQLTGGSGSNLQQTFPSAAWTSADLVH